MAQPAHSIGGPGNNVYVTVLEREGARRIRDEVSPPRIQFERAVIEASTTIYVTGVDSAEPVHVAILSLGGQRVFA